MNSLLDALQEGRLLELPENNKESALRLLAHLIEAIPSIPAGTDVAGLVLQREKTANTSIGMGWACPHARIASDGDMLCAIGWSPAGIDYGIPDQPLVRLIVMYLVPNNQKNLYLKEVSMLVKALTGDARLQDFKDMTDLNTVRSQLLDLITSANAVAAPDARARMIKLETRAGVPPLQVAGLAGMLIEPVTLVGAPGQKPIALTQNRELLECLDGAADLMNSLAQQEHHEMTPWRILKRSSTNFQGDRVIYECLAIRQESQTKSNPA